MNKVKIQFSRPYFHWGNHIESVNSLDLFILKCDELGYCTAHNKNDSINYFHMLVFLSVLVVDYNSYEIYSTEGVSVGKYSIY